MTLTPRQLLIYQGKLCPYCGRTPEYVDSAIIYGKSYGMVYRCAPCDAHVGVHKGTSDALGRLANRELREWKIRAHNVFDPIWKTGRKSRASAYKWLSQQLGIPPEYTHIGYFSVDTCKRVIEIVNTSRK